MGEARRVKHHRWYGSPKEVEQLTRLTRRARVSLREKAARLEAIFETALEGIIVLDGHGVIESINTAAEEIFGYRRKELVGCHITMIMPSPFREDHGDSTQVGDGVRSKSTRIGRETAGLRRNGAVFPMELLLSEFEIGKKGRFYAGFVRDISRRRRMEKEVLEIGETEKRRIGQDLHDGICQQLAGIELMSRVLEQNLHSRSKRAARQVAAIGKHVRQTMEQVRGLSRGLSPLESRPDGLMLGLEALAATTRQMCKKDCRFSCDTPVLIPDEAMAVHLFRVAQEAVGNAIKHAQARRIMIRLEVTGTQLVLAVDDNGSGIPESAPRQGGLGLRTMEHRARLIGGRLVVARRVTGGTRVACTVDVGVSREVPAKAQRRSLD